MGNAVNTITVITVSPDVAFGIVVSFHPTLKVVGANTSYIAWSSYQVVTINRHNEMRIFFQVNKFDIHVAKISIKVEITK